MVGPKWQPRTQENPLVPAFTEKQIFDQVGGREKQDKDDQQPKQAHAPHHPAVHRAVGGRQWPAAPLRQHLTSI